MSSDGHVRTANNGVADARSAFALAIWTGMTLVATVLVWRRASGAFAVATADWIPCVWATAAAMISLVGYSSLQAPGRFVASRRNILAAATTVTLPVILGVAVWTIPSSFVGGYLAVLAGISLAATMLIHDLSSRADQSRAAAPIARQPARLTDSYSEASEDSAARIEPPALDDNASVSDVAESEDDEHPDEDPSIVQWMKRRALVDGGEAVEGSLRLRFSEGVKLAVAHVPFTPPLSARPDAECHVLSDFDGRVTVAAAFSYGLRIEARRTRCESVATVEVTFTAESPASEARAA